MESMDWILSLLGGAIIGIAVSLMLLLNGRVTGIAGIFNGALIPARGDTAWRFYFVSGMILGGLVLRALNYPAFDGVIHSDIWTVPVAGLLVGFGTILGSGCTSGHGVCGISRLSPRSLVATGVFMAAGIAAVWVFRSVGWLP